VAAGAVDHAAGRIRRRLTVLTVVLAVLPLAADALNRVLPEEVATPLE
jgi:hypothetical protein